MGFENNIPEDWIETTLDDVCTKITDGTHSTVKDNSNGDCLLLSCKNIKDGKIIVGENERRIDRSTLEKLRKRTGLQKNDILLTTVGTIGEVAILKTDEIDFELQRSVAIIRVNSNKLLHDYAFYISRSKYFLHQALSRSIGSVQTCLFLGAIKEIEINLPPLPEQKAIAKVLTAFDEKIELLQAQNKTLETMAQTIFKEWFGKYQIGDELPEGWRVANINEFVESSIGGDYGKETTEGDYTEETICLRGTDLPDMKTGTPKKAPIRFLKASKLERCKVENGDIVVEISGGTENQSTGRVMYINERILSSANHPMTCVNFCRIIRPLKLEYSYFLYSLFDYLYNRKVFFNWENGTTGIKNLNLKALLEDFDLFIPENGDLILDFNKNVKASFNKIQSNNSQIQSLTKTRDTILPKLMSGQVRVKNIKHTADA